MHGSPVNKDAMADELSGLRGLFMKSAVLREPRPSGHVLTAADLAAKKPGSGIPGGAIPQLIGRTLTRDLPEDHLIEPTDVEPAWESSDDEDAG